MAAVVEAGGVRLSVLLEGLCEVSAAQDPRILGLTLDSREVKPGWLFLACQGGARHGLDFVPQAQRLGAAAVLWEPADAATQETAELLDETLQIPFLGVPGLSGQISLIAARFYGYPSRRMLMVGITGTNGKTSVSHLLAQALQPATRCGIIGTLGVGYVESLTATGFTTPDAVTLQRLLAQLRADGVQAVAMEVSSHALDQERAAAVHFDTAVFTNISRDHFDYHGGMEHYAAAKQRLFRMPGLGSAVINLDDGLGRTLPAILEEGVRVLSYSLEPDCEVPQGAAGWVKAESVEPTAQGLRVVLDSHLGHGEFHTSLLGRFNAANLLAVLLVLLDQGWELTPALQKLQELKTVAGRMEVYGGDASPAVVIDYAHTPDALEKALSALRSHCEKQLWVVFGCGGDRDRGKRPLMGGIAERLADRVILTDDNPRTEPSEQILEEILTGIQEMQHVQVKADRAAAIRMAIDSASPGDLVLVAGKGHEDYQLINGQRLDFSDQEQVLSALAHRQGAAG